jgi:branched-chain amino acid aminotransferase
MLDPHGFVATCNSTNFCIVRDGEVWAPTTKYQMPGVTRAVVLRAAAAAGITVRETDFSLTSVYGADEAFCTGTFAGLLPVASVDGRVIGACSTAGGPAGAVTARLQALYAKAVEEDVARGRDY